MLEFIAKLFLGLIPQKDDDALKIYNWRWKSLVLGLGALFLGSYAASVLPFFKPPYAMADTVKDLKMEFQNKLDLTNRKVDTVQSQIGTVMAQLKDGQVRSLNSDLIDARRYQCRAINSLDKTALPFWTDRLQSLRIAYQNLAGVPWPNLDCKSF